jgi:hypothetical protein
MLCNPHAKPSDFSIAKGCAHGWCGFCYVSLHNAGDIANLAVPEAHCNQLEHFIANRSNNMRQDMHGLLQWV